MSALPIRLYHAPAQTAAESPPFHAADATVAGIIAWHRDNTARKIDSRLAEAERRRLWSLFVAWQSDSTKPAMGEWRYDLCRPFHLLQFINGQADVDSDWTRRRWNATIQAPFNAAEKLGLIVKNPFRGLTFTEGDQGRDWTDEEYRALLRGSPPILRRFIVGIRFSGLRPGEARELVWPAVHFETAAIVLERHKTRRVTKRPRRVPICATLAKLLRWQKSHNPPAARHVFLNSFGRPWSCKALTKRLAALRAKLGLPDDVKLHGGRHTFATRAVMNGVEIASLMEILGHRLLATTQRYTHVGDKVDHLAASMEQAVKVPKKPARPRPAQARHDDPTPLFDGLGD